MNIYKPEGSNDIPIMTWTYEDKACQGVWIRSEALNGKYDPMYGFSVSIIGDRGMIEVLGEARAAEACSRRWGKKFGKTFADQIRRRAPARGDKWHLDEVVVSIAGEQQWLWRAVDQNGFVLEVIVQRRRDTQAALRLMKRLLKSAVRPPRVMITDKLRSYGAARAKISLRVEHRQHKGLNNRAENSHQPTRRRERIMKRFKSTRQAQRFLTVHDQIANLFHVPYPESVSADRRKALRELAFATWRQISRWDAA